MVSAQRVYSFDLVPLKNKHIPSGPLMVAYLVYKNIIF